MARGFRNALKSSSKRKWGEASHASHVPTSSYFAVREGRGRAHAVAGGTAWSQMISVAEEPEISVAEKPEGIRECSRAHCRQRSILGLQQKYGSPLFNSAHPIFYNYYHINIYKFEKLQVVKFQFKSSRKAFSKMRWTVLVLTILFLAGISTTTYNSSLLLPFTVEKEKGVVGSAGCPGDYPNPSLNGHFPVSHFLPFHIFSNPVHILTISSPTFCFSLREFDMPYSISFFFLHKF